MFAMRLFGMVIVVFMIAVVITQVLVPALMGTKLFPMFRKSRIALEGQLAEVREQLNEKVLKDELSRLKAKLNPVDTNVADAKKEV